MAARPGEGLGPLGERAAARLLKRNGYRVLARNLRSRLGEIDLLAEERATRCLVVVEVKAAGGENPPPEVHVNDAKRRKLTMVAAHLARQRRFVRRYGDRPIRFDVVAVVWPTGASAPRRVTHHANAFEAEW
mgnify:CR=1 FL=1